MRQLSLDLNVPIQPKAALRAVPMNIFSTLGSLQEVIDLAESRLPIINKNDITVLLMIYHNTLINTLNGGTKNDSNKT